MGSHGNAKRGFFDKFAEIPWNRALGRLNRADIGITRPPMLPRPAQPPSANARDFEATFVF